jgi:hypothetical protein
LAQPETIAQCQLTTWLEQVRQLQAAAIAANPDGTHLRQRFLAIQQKAQQHILTLSPPAADAAGTPGVVAFQTELSRTLRLVAVDIQFLAMARQSLKSQARQGQLRDRLTQLLNQGQGLLQALGTESDALNQPGDSE